MDKVAHFYWGGEKLPYLRYLTLYSFAKFNPDWKIELITSRRKDNLPSWGTGEQQERGNEEKIARDYFPELKRIPKIRIMGFDNEEILGLDEKMSDAHSKDLALWHVLATKGGVVFDMDILFFAPIDFDMIKDCDVGLLNLMDTGAGQYITVAFMAGTPNKFFQDVYQIAKAQYRAEDYQSCGRWANPFTSIEAIKYYYDGLKIVNIPRETIFPFAGYHFDKIVNISWLIDRSNEIDKEKTMGLHWYGGQKISSDASLRTANLEQLKKRNCTVSAVAEWIMAGE